MTCGLADIARWSQDAIYLRKRAFKVPRAWQVCVWVTWRGQHLPGLALTTCPLATLKRKGCLRLYVLSTSLPLSSCGAHEGGRGNTISRGDTRGGRGGGERTRGGSKRRRQRLNACTLPSAVVALTRFPLFAMFAKFVPFGHSSPASMNANPTLDAPRRRISAAARALAPWVDARV